MGGYAGGLDRKKSLLKIETGALRDLAASM
jgi:hypothetical protein